MALPLQVSNLAPSVFLTLSPLLHQLEEKSSVFHVKHYQTLKVRWEFEGALNIILPGCFKAAF